LRSQTSIEERTMSAVARPVLHGRFMRSAKQAIVGALVFGISCTTIQYFFYMKPKYERYAKFYANVDPYKMFKDICAHDPPYLKSCPQQLAARYREKGFVVPGDVIPEVETPTTDVE